MNPPPSKTPPPSSSANDDVIDIDQREKQRDLEQDRPKKRPARRFRDFFKAGGSEDFKRYAQLLGHIKPYRTQIIIAFLLSLVCSSLVVAQLYILKDGIARIVSPETAEEADGKRRWPERVGESLGLFPSLDELPDNQDAKRDLQQKQLGLIALFLIAVMLLDALCRYAQSVRMLAVIQKVILDLRMRVFVHLMAQPLRFYQKNHSARLATRMTLDLNRLGTFLSTVVIEWVRETATFLGLVVYVLANNGSFLFAVLGFVALAFIPIRIIGRKIRRGDRAGAQGMADVFAVLQEALTGHREVKAFGSEDREVDRFRDSNKSYQEMMIRLGRLRSRTEPLVSVVGAFGLASLLWIGGGRVIDGSIGPEDFFILILALTRAVASMRRIGKMSNTLNMGLAAADRVTAILSVTPAIRDREEARELKSFRNRIILKNLHFHYDEDSPILKAVNLRIEKGSMVALVGPSGAGKSTLVDLIPRFYEVRKGAIIIDGVDIRNYTQKSLRSHIGVVSQETVLFSHTVRENIAYGRPDASDEEIIEAARAAHAHEFIDRLPDGYDTLVGERGVRFSGGERQRLAIARALLKNPPILILDEATSALDPASEAQVQSALHRLMKGRTVIMIAHRLATVRRADKIVVLSKGEIIEAGAHQELLDQDGVYARLHQLQTSHEDWDTLIEQFDFSNL